MKKVWIASILAALMLTVPINSVVGISATITENQPPEAPMIHGPLQVKPGLTLEYTFNAVDPDGDNVSYFIEWGDGTSNGWSYYFPSGTDATFVHTREKIPDYIRAKAKDYPYEAEGNWSYFIIRDKSSNLELNDRENCFECQPVNKVDVLKVKLLLNRVEVFTNMLLSKFDHIPRIEEKYPEIYDRILMLKEMSEKLRLEASDQDMPILCGILFIFLVQGVILFLIMNSISWYIHQFSKELSDLFDYYLGFILFILALPVITLWDKYCGYF